MPVQWWGILLVVACVVLVFLPPRFDPAIRLKEWLEKDRG